MSDEKTEKIHKNTAFSRWRNSRKQNAAQQSTKMFKLVLVVITIAILFFIITSGVINQADTGKKLTSFSKSWGAEAGNWISNLISGKGPLVYTKEGVYLKDSKIGKDAEKISVDKDTEDKTNSNPQDK